MLDDIIEEIDVIVTAKDRLYAIPFSELESLKLKEVGMLEIITEGRKKTGFVNRNKHTIPFYIKKEGRTVTLNQLSIVYFQNKIEENCFDKEKTNINVTYKKKETKKQEEERMKSFLYLNRRMKEETWIDFKFKPKNI